MGLCHLAGSQYSYTLYDYIGRITEVGQIVNADSTAMTDSISRNESYLAGWISASAAGKEQITQTVYDLAYPGFPGVSYTPVVQRNLRNRVSYTSFTVGSNPAQYNQGTFYTYDIEGNVDTLLQDYGSSSFSAVKNIMNMNGNRFKRMVYQYDLVSGKVNSVAYQPHQIDAFYHRYTYDAENRLILAETSQDSVFWDKEARYDYYKHGPLARIVIGDKMLQGLDYAYTLQGWLKGVNSTSLTAVYDMGRDADTTRQNRYVGKDAYGFGLNYFAGDYSAIGTGVTPFPGSSAYLNQAYRPLYNGNISSMAVNLGPLYRVIPTGGSGDSSHWRGPVLYNYRYDQLNRITGMDAFYGLDQAGNSWAGLMPTVDFKERVSYDGNGNIQKYLRNNFGETGLPMDSLQYGYLTGTNKLTQIKDSAADFVGGGYDLHSQPANNYAYDSIGNLVKDSIEHINSIKWNVYGKITEIDHLTTSTAHPTKDIYYYYDAAGNRIGKKTTRQDSISASYTWYVRDASGNVMATYTATEDTTQALSAADLYIGEKHIYGSSRLGILNANYSTDANTDGLSTYTSPWTGALLPYYTGRKQYELTNHLGNVLATISDKKIGVSLSTDSSLIDHYEADVQTAQDYYPFGMIMPGRLFTALTVPGGSVSGTGQVNGYTLPVDLTLNSRTADKPTEYVATQYIDLTEGFESGDSTDMVTAYIADTSYAGTGNGGSGADGVAGAGKYRYGFNGKENDNEVKGIGDQQDYGKRIYDPRTGRFLSVDPIQAKYPDLTPYQFASNSPIAHLDLDGLEKYHYTFTFDKQGQTHIELTSTEHFSEWQWKPKWGGTSLGFQLWQKVQDPQKEYIVEYKFQDYLVVGVAAEPVTTTYSSSFNSESEALNGKFSDFDGAVRKGDIAKGLMAGADIPGIPTRSKRLSPENETNKAASGAHGGTPEATTANAAVENSAQKISLKDPTPPRGESGAVGYSLSDGKINLNNRSVTSGTFDFVVTNEGKLVIGSKHFSLAAGENSVQAAGQLRIYKGKVMDINNNSGHYKPTINEAKNFGNILKNAGVDVSGANLNILNEQGVKVSGTKL